MISNIEYIGREIIKENKALPKLERVLINIFFSDICLKVVHSKLDMKLSYYIFEFKP